MKYKKPFRLQELKIEVTNFCPLSCIHCSSDSNPEPSYLKEINIEKCISIIKEAVELGAIEISFSGGEPLCWEGIFDAVEATNQYNMNVCVYSSGNVDDIESALGKLKGKGLSRLIFSIYSHNPIEHERITRKKGSFNLTLNAMKNAAQLNIETELHFVALKQNYRHLKQVAELGKTYGINKVSVLRFVPQGRGSLLNKSILDRVDNIRLKKEIECLRSNYDIRTGSPFNFLLINEPKCLSAINRLIIAPDLRLYPCDAFKNILAEEVVGDIKLSSLEDETLADCWAQSPYLNAIRDYLNTPFEEPCQSCMALEQCLSGCIAQKVIAYGGLYKKPDPSCLVGF